MTDDDNVPRQITQRMALIPGMQPGEQGTAGLDKPGPSVKVVAVPLREYIATELLFFYCKAWLSVSALWAAGQLADYGHPKSAVLHVLLDLSQISICALVPTVIAVVGELAIHLQRRRQALGLAEK